MLSILSVWVLLFHSLFFGQEKSASAPHPFYVSVAEINHNASEKALEVSVKFFADDLEHTLENAYKAKLDVTSEKEKAAFDKYIADYVGKHFRLSADGKAVTLRYLGYEKDREAVYAYFDATGLSSVKRLDVGNDLLYDFIKEQINIMHVTVGGNRQSSKLNYPEARAAFQF